MRTHSTQPLYIWTTLHSTHSLVSSKHHYAQPLYTIHTTSIHSINKPLYTVRTTSIHNTHNLYTSAYLYAPLACTSEHSYINLHTGSKYAHSYSTSFHLNNLTHILLTFLARIYKGVTENIRKKGAFVSALMDFCIGLHMPISLPPHYQLSVFRLQDGGQLQGRDHTHYGQTHFQEVGAAPA